MKISDSIDPHTLDSNKLRALWALDQLETATEDRFSPATIAKYLVEHGINASRQGIEYGLRGAKRAINSSGKGYKLMEIGRKLLLELDYDQVVIVEPGKPFSAKNVKLKKLFAVFSGTVYISDPWVDINTLDVVFKLITSNVPVKILTNKLGDKPTGVFARHLGDLRQEGYQIEVGVYNGSDLHDRYIMDSTSFWLSGNSLNYLGRKESFIVKLGDDIKQSMMNTFMHRWKSSTKI